MSELQEIAKRFGTDKVESGYLGAYERYFAPSRDKPIALLEIGVLRGASLLTWQEYFPRGRIVGLDINEIRIAEPADRITLYKGLQQDTGLLDRIGRESAPDGFDIIIDDAAHIGSLARTSFWHLFVKHLKPGGIYVLEDWGTGYWASWPDGAQYQDKVRGIFSRFVNIDKQFSAHNFGMVGLIKELVDDCGRADITHATRGTPPQRQPRIDELIIRSGHAFVRKPLTTP